MAGEQLERSILERKERDELHAIANAMSLKPTARQKKSDIIDLILRATGVDVDAVPESGPGNDQRNVEGNVEIVIHRAGSNGAVPFEAAASLTISPLPSPLLSPLPWSLPGPDSG